jgi:hypothetical protein
MGKQDNLHIDVNKDVKCILSLPDLLSLRNGISNLSVT